MFLPLDMVPARHVAPQYLEADHYCPCCSKCFTTKDGVVFRASYTRNGEPKYGRLIICSLECILVHFPPQGRA